MEHGYSTFVGKQEAKKFLKQYLYPNDKICDVGAGGGTYYFLLGRDYEWTAVEIFHENAEYLKNKYNKIYEEDIRTFDYPDFYDLIIFGDVIEHMSVEDAQKVLTEAKKHTKMIMVSVPYELEQDAIHNNEYERHLQPDLTPTIFKERYPEFKSIVILPQYGIGYYYWRANE